MFLVVLFHLLLDAMWLDPETLWWPLLGWEFTPVAAGTAGDYVAGVLGDWKVWLGEAAGLAYLTYLWRAAGLADADSRRAFMASGRVEVPIDGDVTC